MSEDCGSAASRSRLLRSNFLHGSIIEDTTDNGEAAEGGHDLIAGDCVAVRAEEELDRQLDYLFVRRGGTGLRSPQHGSRWV